MSENMQLQTTSNKLPSQTIKVDPLLGGALDLSMLTEEQQREVAKRYADGVVDQAIKVHQTRTDIAALESDLGIINENVNKAMQGGYSMQAEQTFNTAYGKTTVIVGNTERASAGKVSGSISGDSANWLKIVVVIAVAVVLFAVFSQVSAVLTYAVRLHPGSDLTREQERLLAVLRDSPIAPHEKAFLADQVASVVSQYRRQLALNGGKRYAMRRAFEGDGYAITVTIGEKPLSRLLNFWRG